MCLKQRTLNPSQFQSFEACKMILAQRLMRDIFADKNYEKRSLQQIAG
jgi:hypothetical protein